MRFSLSHTHYTTIGMKWAVVESIPANILPMVLYLESKVLCENDSEVRCVVRCYYFYSYYSFTVVTVQRFLVIVPGSSVL